MYNWLERSGTSDSIQRPSAFLRSLFLVIVGIVAVGAIEAAAMSSPSPARIPPGSIVTGGPDAWGYAYVDNDTTPGVPGRPTFNWLDIRGAGTRVNGLSDDNLAGPFSMGFVFPLYWQNYSSLYVGSNGYLAFDDDYNSAHPFPDVPAAQRPNNLIEPLMSDLDFTGLDGNRGCWMWTNTARDTFIVQCESVPFWNVSGSNNTFEVVLSRIDTTITFQYLEQTGAPYYGWSAGNATVGIENITGLTGLRYLYGNVPANNNIHAGLAVRFAPPASSSYTIRDVWTKHVMSHNSLGMFLNYPIVQPTPVWAIIKNAGNLTVGSTPVNASICRVPGNTVVWSASNTIPGMTVGAETTLAFGSWTPSDTGTYTLSVVSALANDQYRGNDTVLVEMHVINYFFPTVLAYDGATSGSVSLMGPHGYSVKFAPPRYPVRLERLYFDFTGSMVPVTIYVYDDNGPAGSPGTILDSVANHMTVSGWDSVDITPDSVNIQSGGFFVGYRTSYTSAPSICYDATIPHSRQNWEYTGAWAPFRTNETQDLRIRARVTLGTALHNIGVIQILAPSGTLDSGSLVTPRAVVRNVGLSNENAASATFQIPIAPGYQATRTFTLGRGRDTTITFDAWAARPGFGIVPRCSVYTPGDVDPDNDTLSGALFDVRYLDAGTVGIDRPQDTVESGTVTHPRVTVRNFGNIAGNVNVRLYVPGTGYDRTQTVFLGAGVDDTVAFAAWTPDSGNYTLRCSTGLAGDMNDGNDLATAALFVRYADVQTSAILAPADSADSGRAVVPVAIVANNGNVAADFSVSLRISDGEYAQTRTKTLAAHASDTLGFPGWTPVGFGLHAVVCSTAYNRDRVPANDRASGSVFVRTRDVGATAIVSPPATVDPGTVVVPQAVVRNFGHGAAGFDVRFEISDGYAQSAAVASLSPGRDTLVEFSAWTVPPRGAYDVTCYTMLAGDCNPGNDTVQSTVAVGVHDVGCSAVLSPLDTIDSLPQTPSALLRNFGRATETFTAWYRIADSAGIQVYLGNATVSDLAPGDAVTKEFPIWSGHHPLGVYATECHTDLAHDVNRANDTARAQFIVAAPSLLPHGWHRMANVPNGPKYKRVKDGGALAFAPDLSDTSFIYALKGNNTCEFYRYNVTTNCWTTRESIPAQTANTKKKKVKKGSSLVEAQGALYATKGNNTREFWEYLPLAADGYPWLRQSDVPAGAKNIREGAGTVCVESPTDSARIYLLKGSSTNEFYCYDVANDSWATRASVVRGASGKPFRDGSCITCDRSSGIIYALKANYNEFFAYQIDSDKWTTRASLPFIGGSGAKRKAKSGASLAAVNGLVYALKGNNTREFWCYRADSNRWQQTDDMPIGDSKRVKGGGSLIRGDILGQPALWALKGNNTFEFWQYLPGFDYPLLTVSADANAMASPVVLLPADCRLNVLPNPCHNQALITYSLSRPGLVRISLYDLTGKPAAVVAVGHAETGTYSHVLNTARLTRGVYFLRVDAGALTQTRKLIIE